MTAPANGSSTAFAAHQLLGSVRARAQALFLREARDPFIAAFEALTTLTEALAWQRALNAPREEPRTDAEVDTTARAAGAEYARMVTMDRTALMLFNAGAHLCDWAPTGSARSRFADADVAMGKQMARSLPDGLTNAAFQAGYSDAVEDFRDEADALILRADPALKQANLDKQGEKHQPAIIALAQEAAVRVMQPATAIHEYLRDRVTSADPTERIALKSFAALAVQAYGKAWIDVRSGDIPSTFGELFPAHAQGPLGARLRTQDPSTPGRSSEVSSLSEMLAPLVAAAPESARAVATEEWAWPETLSAKTIEIAGQSVEFTKPSRFPGR